VWCGWHVASVPPPAFIGPPHRTGHHGHVYISTVHMPSLQTYTMARCAVV
jgi:hypothetical protein